MRFTIHALLAATLMTLSFGTNALPLASLGKYFASPCRRRWAHQRTGAVVERTPASPLADLSAQRRGESRPSP
jgi:hypothetical protein